MKNIIHYKDKYITEKIEGLFHIIPLKELRQTNKVNFQMLHYFDEFNGVDIVKHEAGANSPGIIKGKNKLWYMHPSQEDNLITLNGNRIVELYTKKHGKVEKFEISYKNIKWNGKIILEGPGMLGWPKGVFHRNSSLEGSISMNFAVRDNNFDIDTEFNIYDIDTKTGKYDIIRIGKLDQPKL